VITFRGKTPEEIIASFHRSVDTYLDFCEEQKQKPEKPFAGKIPFRTSPEEHYNIYMAAKLEDKSINAWMNDILAEAAQRTIATVGEGAAVPPSVGEIAAAPPAFRPYYSVFLESSEKTEEKEVEVAPSVHFITSRPYEVHTTPYTPIQVANTTIGDIVAEAVQRITNVRSLFISRSRLEAIVAETIQEAMETTQESIPEPTKGTPSGSSYIIAPYEPPSSNSRTTKSLKGGVKGQDIKDQRTFG
jgi:predicted HicB family RNase H-like nuclease